jgi:outer membrane protein OmpA-like peptidoglycan-associated protein
MKKSLLLLVLLLCSIMGFAQDKLTVFFDFDRYELNDIALKKLSNWTLTSPDVEVTKVYGFCDWKGTNSYNDSLSIKRVNAVVEFMKAHQIKVNAGYDVRGFGEDFEQSKVQSENRKVIIEYQDKPVEVKKEQLSALHQKIKSANKGDMITLDNLYFFNMSPRLLPKSKPILYDLLCAMQENPNLKIEIQGHICCQVNGDVYNLSTSRARAIFNFLVSQRINRKRLSYIGFGTTRPIHPIPEQSEQQENENRRVEILIKDN